MSEFRDYAEWDRHTAINEGYGADHAVYDPAEMVRAFMAGGCGMAYSKREREQAQWRLDLLEEPRPLARDFPDSLPNNPPKETNQ